MRKSQGFQRFPINQWCNPGLLEKFFAKQVGSYMALKGFDTRKVWKALTGCEERFP